MSPPIYAVGRCLEERALLQLLCRAIYFQNTRAVDLSLRHAATAATRVPRGLRPAHVTRYTHDTDVLSPVGIDIGGMTERASSERRIHTRIHTRTAIRSRSNHFVRLLINSTSRLLSDNRGRQHGFGPRSRRCVASSIGRSSSSAASTARRTVELRDIDGF